MHKGEWNETTTKSFKRLEKTETSLPCRFFRPLPAEYRHKEGECYVESRKRPGILISATTLFHICTSWSRQLCRITAFHEVMNINSCQFRIPLYPQKPSDIGISPFKHLLFFSLLQFLSNFLSYALI